MFSRLIQTNKQNFQIERVKFGVTLDEVCTIYNDIPGPLLILILKLNKEAPYKKDVFRAPGHQSNMKKLIHCLQNGRLVNIDHFTVYTIASVLKKFLRKLPGGIFSTENEEQLFNLIKSNELSLEEKQKHISSLIANLPLVNQHLLVLLFGTFNAIANLAKRLNTGMTSEAIGVSVAPSFFHSCVPIGCKVARMEDVQKFKLATLATQFLIDNFGVFNLFGLENYKYYGRISGRLIKVIDNCIVANKYPYANTLPLDSRIVISSDVDECQSMPALYGSSCLNSINQNLLKKQTQSIHRDSCASNCEKPFSSLLSQTNQSGLFQLHPHSTSSSFTHYSINQPQQHLSSHQAQEHYNSDDIYGRLSMSLENSVFKSNNSPCNVSSSSTSPSNIVSLHGEFNETSSGIFDQRQISLPLHYSTQCSPKIGSSKDQTDKANEDIIEEEIKNLDQLKIVNKYAESTKSLSFLPIVHERQTARMKTRSEWFLNPNEHSGAESDDDVCASKNNQSNYSAQKFTTNSNILSYKEPGVNGTRSKAILRKTSSKEKRIIRRSSSKKDKENGNNCSVLGSSSNMSSTNTPKFGVLNPDIISKDEKCLGIGSSYKPRI